MICVNYFLDLIRIKNCEPFAKSHNFKNRHNINGHINSRVLNEMTIKATEKNNNLLL